MFDDDIDPEQMDMIHDYVWDEEEAEDAFAEADWDWDVEDDE